MNYEEAMRVLGYLETVIDSVTTASNWTPFETMVYTAWARYTASGIDANVVIGDASVEVWVEGGVSKEQCGYRTVCLYLGQTHAHISAYHPERDWEDWELDVRMLPRLDEWVLRIHHVLERMAEHS